MNSARSPAAAPSPATRNPLASVLGRQGPAELALPAFAGSDSPWPAPSALDPARRIAMGTPCAAAGLRADSRALRALAWLPLRCPPAERLSLGGTSQTWRSVRVVRSRGRYRR